MVDIAEKAGKMITSASPAASSEKKNCIPSHSPHRDADGLSQPSLTTFQPQT